MAGERTVRIRFDGVVKGLVAAVEKSSTALDRWERQADKVAATAGRVSRVVGTMIKPGAVPALAAFAPAAIGTAAALGAAGAAMGVFGGVLKSTQTEITEAADKYQDLGDKIELYGKQAEIQASRGESNEAMLKKQAKAMLELEARLALLPPNQRAATMAFIKMRSSWTGFVDDNKPRTFGILERGYKLIGDNVAKLQPLFDLGARAAERALGSLERFAAGGGVERFVAFLTANAGPAIDNLGRIGKNVFTFIGALFKQTADDGQGFLTTLAEATEKLAAFGTGGGLERLLDTLAANGPGAGQVLVDVGRAAVTIAQAVGPLAPVSIAIAGALAQIIAAVPPPVLTVLVGAWIAYAGAMGTFNAVARVTAPITALLTAEKTKSAAATVRATIAEKASAAATVAGNAARAAGRGIMVAWTAATNLFSAANVKAAASAVASTTATVAMGVAQRVAAAATVAWTVATRILGITILGTPLGWILLAIAAVVTVIVLIATKTTWFQDIWKVVWGAIKTAAAAVSAWFTGTLLPSLQRAYDQLRAALDATGRFFKTIWNGIVAAVNFAKNMIAAHIRAVITTIRTINAGIEAVRSYVLGRINTVVGYFSNMKGRISSAASGLFDGVKNAFRSAINFIIDKWNNLSFSLPSVNTPFGTIGGTTLSTPNIGRLATGGWAQPGRTYLTGERGPELISVGRRAHVTPATGTAALLGAGGATPTIHVYIGDRELTDIVDVQIESRDRQTRRRASSRVAGAY